MYDITILGAKESGVGAALLAKRKGKKIFISDKNIIKENYKKILIDNNIEFEERTHSINKIFDSKEIIKSPGIPNNIPLIRKIKEKGIKIISDLDFAYRYIKAPIIGITGSNGKTTVAALLAHILKHAGKRVSLCGNIGNSICKEILKNDYEIYVIELSSFQLEDIKEFKSDIAIITNISEDHLDRYDYDIDKYADAKFRILNNMNPTDHIIFPKDDIIINKKILKYNIIKHPIYGNINNISFNLIDGLPLSNVCISNLKLKGKHNILNIKLASKAAKLLNIEIDKIKESIKTFKEVEHRLEFVKEINGIKFYNDSKATNIASVTAALNSFSKPIIWLAGGLDKGNDYSLIKDLVNKKVKALICIGEDNVILKDTFKNKFKFETISMKDAVLYAYELADKGDIVLLSPGCSSFDLFENFEQRGKAFEKQVISLNENIC